MARDIIHIQVDENFRIDIDRQNWTVIHRHKGRTSKAKDKYVETEVSYCHDLPAALQCIMRTKTEEGEGKEHIVDYLAWYDTTIHTILNRILDQKDKLIKAVDLNWETWSKNIKQRGCG